jgi:cysteine-rich repeat protein
MDRTGMKQGASSMGETHVLLQSWGPARDEPKTLVPQRQWRLPMNRIPGRQQLTSMVAALVVLATLTGGARLAGAQITGLVVDNTGSSSVVSNGAGQNICTTNAAGTVAPLGGNAGESRNSVTIPTNTSTGFTTRFVADLCSDSGGSTAAIYSCISGVNTQNLAANYNVQFGVKAPAGTTYRLTVTNKISGAAEINNDSSVAGTTTGSISNVTTTAAGSTLFGGGSLNLSSAVSMNSAGDVYNPISQTATTKYTGTGTGASIPQTITAQWSGQCSAPNQGDECAVRIGSACTITGASLLNDTHFGPGGKYPDNGNNDCTALQSPYFCCTGNKTGTCTANTRTQANDGQFVTVGLEFCGDGVLQSDGVLNEACDNGLDPVSGNGGTNSCCTADCQIIAASTVCRAVGGECDLQEICNGVSGLCPADAKKPFNTACTPDSNVCTADICNGTSNACQHPAGNPGTVCRASLDLACDPAEFCDGASTTCPPDVRLPTGSACPADSNPCTQDICNSGSGMCTHPAGNAGAVCRASTDSCDVTETCTGSDVNCPADAVEPVNTTCPDDGHLCTKDICNGVSKACTHPTSLVGTICRPAVDPICDEDEECNGTNIDCPPDAVETRQISCRAAVGPCDVGEYCTGTTGMCPPDAKQPAGTVCRPQIGGDDGLCDIAETCDGITNDCPADGLQPVGTICRSAVGPCDVAETCDGTRRCAGGTQICQNDGDCGGGSGSCVVPCPPDQLADSSVVCRDVAPGALGICDVPEYCTGTDPNCPFDQKQDPSLVCRPAGLNICDVDEHCDGTNNVCPPDQFAPASVVCRASAGICDTDEFCTGTSATCPADSFVTNGTLCRAADPGGCDVAETCTGSSALCPPDGFKSASYLCRAADSSGCDVDDYCTGSNSACPPDAKKPDGTLCAGTNPNTCLNSCITGTCTDVCPGSGDVNHPADPDNPCPIAGTVVVPNCCGNGLQEGTEQCDDGNQLSADTCPSLPSDACQIGIPGNGSCTGPGQPLPCCTGLQAGTCSDLIRGNTRNPATDRTACQIEYSVLNPKNKRDKYGQPSNLQICEDQDPTCDLDPRPGRCRFHVVACLNANDVALPMCKPNGVNTLQIVNLQYLRKSSPQLTVVGENMSALTHGLQSLYDPSTPGMGFSVTPPLLADQQDICSGGMLIDVFAGSAFPRQSQVVAQRYRVRSKNNTVNLLCTGPGAPFTCCTGLNKGTCRVQRNTSNLILQCKARALP